MKNSILGMAVLAALPWIAHAEHDGTVHVDAVDVVAKKQSPSLTQPDIATAKETLAKTAGGTTIVDMTQVREGRTSNMQDTLGMATGVLAQSRFGAEETRLSIRGSGLQRTFHGRGLKLMQDGIPTNLADGGFDFPSIDPMATDYIEVYRGANALQYGSTNLGGSINFISRTGHNASPLEVRTEGGSYGYYRLGVSTGGVHGDVDYFVTASQYGTNSFRDNAVQSADRLTGNVGYRISDTVETRFYLGYTNNDSELSSPLTKAQLKDDPKQATTTTGQGINQRDINVTRLANKTTLVFDQSTLELGAFYAHKSLFHPIIDLFGFTGGFVDTLGVIDQNTNDFGLSARWLQRGQLFGWDNEFIAGMTPTYGRTDAKNYRNVNGRRGALVNDFDQKASNIELFVENRVHLNPQWTAIAGLQYARAKRDSKDQLIRAATGDQSVNETYSQTSPKIGLLYQVHPQVQLFTNLSHSFEPPSFGELNVAVSGFLKAQTGNTLEIGSRGNSEYVDWDIAVYYARLKDELLALGTTNSPTTINADKTIHKGIEFGLTARLPYHLQWRSSLLMNDFRLDGDSLYGNNKLPGIQRSLLRAELVYRGSDVLENLYLGPTIEWSPQRYNVDFAETAYADSYFLWGIKAGQKVNARWSWFVEGRNLADQKYAATTGIAGRWNGTTALYYPGDGRTAYAGVTWNY